MSLTTPKQLPISRVDYRNRENQDPVALMQMLFKALDDWYKHQYTDMLNLDTLTVGKITAADGDATPDVKSIRVMRTANTGSTSITMLDNGVDGQRVTVIAGDANTTIVHNASKIVTRSGSDITMSQNETRTFVYDYDNSLWYEVS